MTDPKPFDDYHEEDGCVLWFHMPIQEPPYCGSPCDEDFPWADIMYANQRNAEERQEKDLATLYFVALPEIFFEPLQHPLHKEVRALRARVKELEAKTSSADYGGQIMIDARRFLKTDDGLFYTARETEYGAHCWAAAVEQARREAE